ncbi:hypothetical protein B0H15DRAFT_846049 [Mycena belliarum]|uniref:Uncharacterized protein n=1 Tax=Mycena belliarum TaxID=1033014 RepID=A0AAD6U5N6_9AGAR|nr:hypothetical protein B0H15DRAFT_846049 [Mycena belliae]
MYTTYLPNAAFKFSLFLTLPKEKAARPSQIDASSLVQNSLHSQRTAISMCGIWSEPMRKCIWRVSFARHAAFDAGFVRAACGIRRGTRRFEPGSCAHHSFGGRVCFWERRLVNPPLTWQGSAFSGRCLTCAPSARPRGVIRALYVQLGRDATRTWCRVSSQAWRQCTRANLTRSRGRVDGGLTSLRHAEARNIDGVSLSARREIPPPFDNA